MSIKHFIFIFLFILTACATAPTDPIKDSSSSLSLGAKCRNMPDCVHAISIAIKNNYYWKEQKTIDHKLLNVKISISLKQDGSLIAAKVVQSSGNKAFDKAALIAVKRAAPFTTITGLKKSVFEKHFGGILLDFTPPEKKKLKR